MQTYQMAETESAKWDSDDAREMDAARREIRATARALCERDDAVEVVAADGVVMDVVEAE